MWPVTVLIAIVVFRKPLGDLMSVIGQRIDKVSFAGVSLELKKASELKVSSLDADLRELDAGTRPQSGPIDLLVQLRNASDHDYIVIDLGSESAPRWLTSRLYLFGLILSRERRLKCFVFVETAAGIRNRFIGTASPEAVRWAFAKHYPWLEYAYTQACLKDVIPQFDATTGWLVDWQASSVVQQFLASIRVGGNAPPNPLPFADPLHPPQLIDLGNGIQEYAKWVDGDRIERLLGQDLMTSSLTPPPGQVLDDMIPSVLKLRGRFVAYTDADRMFRGLIDRSALLEHLAITFARRP
jgi:hypothetical protein